MLLVLLRAQYDFFLTFDNFLALFGTVEELGQSYRTRTAVNDQFATNFFGPVNIIKSSLPYLRHQRNGHIVILTGISKLFFISLVQLSPYMSALISSSWPHWHARPRVLLLVTMGVGRLLRQPCI